MRFIDSAVIKVKGGKGGDGIISFRHEPFIPKGGPNGGNGGKGGDVVLHADAQLMTLEDIALNKQYRAENGNPGEGNRKAGRYGQDIIIRVPVGTLVWDDENDIQLADLTEDGEKVIIARGGRGGRGNMGFATSRNRAPRMCQPGDPGQELTLRIELKLLADVGLVGKPNAGKSTLLGELTRANPRIGAYPFSTLSPALGVVQVTPYHRFIVADLPGLAEGASEGKGLGFRFLRHVERTRMIVLMIEAPETSYKTVYNQLVYELANYNEDLALVPRILVLSKIDLERGDVSGEVKFDVELSSLTDEGLNVLVDLLADKLGIPRLPAGRAGTHTNEYK